jgi:DNA repair exonuclease SbcCD ATPase subunit
LAARESDLVAATQTIADARRSLAATESVVQRLSSELSESNSTRTGDVASLGSRLEAAALALSQERAAHQASLSLAQAEMDKLSAEHARALAELNSSRQTLMAEMEAAMKDAVARANGALTSAREAFNQEAARLHESHAHDMGVLRQTHAEEIARLKHAAADELAAAAATHAATLSAEKQAHLAALATLNDTHSAELASFYSKMEEQSASHEAALQQADATLQEQERRLTAQLTQAKARLEEEIDALKRDAHQRECALKDAHGDAMAQWREDVTKVSSEWTQREATLVAELDAARASAQQQVAEKDETFGLKLAEEKAATQQLLLDLQKSAAAKEEELLARHAAGVDALVTAQKQEIAAFETKLSALIEAHSEQMSAVQQEISDYKAAHSKSDSEHEEKRAELEKFIDAGKGLLSRLQAERAAAEEQVSLLNEELRLLDEELGHTRMVLGDTEAALDMEKRAVVRESVRADESEKAAMRLRKDLEARMQDIAELTTQNSTLDATNRDATEERRRATDQVETLKRLLKAHNVHPAEIATALYGAESLEENSPSCDDTFIEEDMTAFLPRSTAAYAIANKGPSRVPTVAKAGGARRIARAAAPAMDSAADSEVGRVLTEQVRLMKAFVCYGLFLFLLSKLIFICFFSSCSFFAQFERLEKRIAELEEAKQNAIAGQRDGTCFCV